MGSFKWHLHTTDTSEWYRGFLVCPWPSPVYWHVCRCVCARARVCVCVCMCARARVCMCVCVHACVRTCVHICVHGFSTGALVTCYLSPPVCTGVSARRPGPQRSSTAPTRGGPQWLDCYSWSAGAATHDTVVVLVGCIRAYVRTLQWFGWRIVSR